jgi:hypothetical protein
LHEAIHSCGQLSEEVARELTKRCTGYDPQPR